MLLIDLLDGDNARLHLHPDFRHLEISGLTADSRAVRPGYLFAALAGSRLDGRKFIADAVARGAAAVLVGREAAEPAPDIPVELVADDNPRRRLALMAARFYAHQPATIAAVTGTNGKTSVVGFTRQLWATTGRKAGSLGTLGIVAPSLRRTQSLTTPDPVLLHATLAELAAGGIDHLAMEASSHGLDQYRLDGARITIGAFTNLSRDHYDYHGDVAGYLAAKSRLFSHVMRPGGVAVLNADTSEYASLAEVCRDRGHCVWSYGRAGGDVRLDSIEPLGDGQHIGFEIEARRHELVLPLLGAFQVSNALCALAIAIASGVDAASAVDAMSRLAGEPGRMQLVGRRANNAAVYVDYAHTPDALDTVLAALRPHCARRLAVVFGCGGDRDAGKRPEMGRIAQARADRLFVTDDNPRTEDASAIRRQIMTACPDAREIGDRAEAIRAAVADLAAGDLLVIAGKGHERTQSVGADELPFDDVEIATRALAEIEGEG